MQPSARGKEYWRWRLEDAELGAIAPDLVRLGKSAIRLNRSATREEDLPLGASKVGGSADLVLGDCWPQWQGRPLTLMAQIDLAEIRAYDVDLSLPPAGRVLFFYDAMAQPAGHDPADRGSCRVVYQPAPAGLFRVPPPENLPELARSYACAVDFHVELTLPPVRSSEVARLQLTDEHIQQYWRLMRDEMAAERPDHHLLGHPSAIQGDMPLQCELTTNGLYCGNRSAYDDPRRMVVEAGSDEWVLLLQIDTDAWASMMWRDHGTIYFWIRRDDLALRCFDGVWAILQCY